MSLLSNNFLLSRFFRPYNQNSGQNRDNFVNRPEFGTMSRKSGRLKGLAPYIKGKKSEIFQNKFKTKVFSKLNTSGLSLVLAKEELLLLSEFSTWNKFRDLATKLWTLRNILHTCAPNWKKIKDLNVTNLTHFQGKKCRWCSKHKQRPTRVANYHTLLLLLPTSVKYTFYFPLL